MLPCRQHLHGSFPLGVEAGLLQPGPCRSGLDPRTTTVATWGLSWLLWGTQSGKLSAYRSLTRPHSLAGLDSTQGPGLG